MKSNKKLSNYLFANSKNEGGILNKNAFTLIELLAIIVILAIIAVITVPIILNIIENSKKGAAQDSAYGYKDAVNKAYVTELSKPNNENLKLQGEYSVSNGVLNGTGFSNVEIPLSGTKPSSGKLHYTNNILDDGCLVIGDYKITFKSDGSINETVKGNCDDYVVSGGSEQSNGGQSSSVPTIASCPGCKFIYTTDDTYGIVGSDYDDSSDMPAAADLTNDYRNLQMDVDIWIADDDTEYYDSGECYYANNDTECESVTTSVQRPYFLGLISTSDSTKIERAFACGIENDTPFCLEGFDPSKYSDDENVGILNTIFPECGADASNSSANCGGSSVSAHARDDGDVDVYGDDGSCSVYSNGRVYCYDS